jgi:tetratricopeptide (TPR) repeat protein
MLKNQIAIFGFVLISASGAYAQTGAAAEAADLVKQAAKLEFGDTWKEALTLYRQAVEKNPSQFDAYLGIGRILDVEGQYEEARQNIQKGIDAAPDNGLSPALSTMAVAYAFEGKAADSAKYYQQVFDRQIKANAPDAAAGTANALGRVYLETEDLANAEKWYRTGYETAQKIDKLTPEDKDLWEMRWQHAQARIAARGKRFDVARKHADLVKAIVARGNLDEGQIANYPHLLGYIGFYEGKYDAAIAELSKAEQQDPFVLSMLAQAYELNKNPAQARELYARILTLRGHSLQAAFALPLARRKTAQ